MLAELRHPSKTCHPFLHHASPFRVPPKTQIRRCDPQPPLPRTRLLPANRKLGCQSAGCTVLFTHACTARTRTRTHMLRAASDRLYSRPCASHQRTEANCAASERHVPADGHKLCALCVPFAWQLLPLCARRLIWRPNVRLRVLKWGGAVSISITCRTLGQLGPLRITEVYSSFSVSMAPFAPITMNHSDGLNRSNLRQAA